jgi:hypothetical protein
LIGGVISKVSKKHFSYTSAGKKAAKKYAEMTGVNPTKKKK